MMSLRHLTLPNIQLHEAKNFRFITLISTVSFLPVRNDTPRYLKDELQLIVSLPKFKLIKAYKCRLCLILQLLCRFGLIHIMSYTSSFADYVIPQVLFRFCLVPEVLCRCI